MLKKPTTGRRRIDIRNHIWLAWGFLCQGGITPFLSSFVIPFFCSTCVATFFRPDRIFESPSRAAAVKVGPMTVIAMSREIDRMSVSEDLAASRK
jgi:hypothetical protein